MKWIISGGGASMLESLVQRDGSREPPTGPLHVMSAHEHSPGGLTGVDMLELSVVLRALKNIDATTLAWQPILRDFMANIVTAERIAEAKKQIGRLDTIALPEFEAGMAACAKSFGAVLENLGIHLPWQSKTSKNARMLLDGGPTFIDELVQLKSLTQKEAEVIRPIVVAYGEARSKRLQGQSGVEVSSATGRAMVDDTSRHDESALIATPSTVPNNALTLSRIKKAQARLERVRDRITKFNAATTGRERNLKRDRVVSSVMGVLRDLGVALTYPQLRMVTFRLLRAPRETLDELVKSSVFEAGHVATMEPFVELILGMKSVTAAREDVARASLSPLDERDLDLALSATQTLNELGFTPPKGDYMSMVGLRFITNPIKTLGELKKNVEDLNDEERKKLRPLLMEISNRSKRTSGKTAPPSAQHRDRLWRILMGELDIHLDSENL